MSLRSTAILPRVVNFLVKLFALLLNTSLSTLTRLLTMPARTKKAEAASNV